MHFGKQPKLWLAVLAVTMVTCAATSLPVSAAQATAPDHWIGWGLEVEFPNDQLEVIYTVYIGVEDPKPRVLASAQRPITGDCDIQGLLEIVNGEAYFDGSDYIQCEVPSWRAELAALAPQLPPLPDDHCWCEAGGGPLFVAVDARLDPVVSPALNPVFETERTGISFSLPSNGVDARGRLRLSSGTYQTPPWAAQSAGNRVLIGQRGPAVAAVATHFKWLDYLDQGWKPYFTSQVVGPRMGHWTEEPIVGSRQPAAPYQLGTQRDIVYIGYSPTSGAFFHGALSRALIDPGCDPPA